MSQTMEWNVKETFTFPHDFGCVKDVKSINVQANWECEQLLEKLHIHGIYHIMAKVQFNKEARAQPGMGTLIEHVDLMEDEGYFEYALPFRLELPMMEVKSLRVEDIQTTCSDAFDITWQVMCAYDEITTTHVTDHEKIFIEKAVESSSKDVQEIHKKKAVENVMESSSTKEMIEMVAEEVVEVAEEVVEVAEEVVEVAEELVQEIAEKVTEKMAVKMVEEIVEEFVEERLEEYTDESRHDSTEFLFHLEDGYRKDSFALNKVRNK